ncbi:MAG: ABC transporter permease [Myxococcota bacterium]
MIALIRKELHGARPYVYAVIALTIIQIVSEAAQATGIWSAFETATYEVEGVAILCGLVAFSLGHSLPAEEYEHDHIEFLAGLPITRSAVFFAKAVALMLPVVAMVLSTGLIKFGVVWLAGAPDAYGATDVILTEMIRMLSLCVGLAGLGMLLSWVGGLGWGVIGIALFGISVAGHFIPLIRPFGVMQGMMMVEWDGPEIRSAWAPVLTWWGVGLFGILGSAILFQGPGRLLMSRRTFAGKGLRIVATGCGGLFIALLTVLMGLGGALQFGERLMADTTVQRTEHFVFLYEKNDSAAATALIAEAEDLNQQLTEAIGTPNPVSLEIELLGASSAHAGVFLGGKIRMSLGKTGRDTFIHELAHAHAFELRGGPSPFMNETRFFEEGFARYFERKVGGTQADWSWAAAVHKSGQSRFHWLVDDGLRQETYDADQAYPLGEAFVHALVLEHGSGAPACIQQAFGKRTERDVSGMGLWFAVSETCEVDLGAVIARYNAFLDEQAQDVPPLPELVAKVDPENYALQVSDFSGVGGAFLCRFRDQAEDSRNLFQQRSVDRHGRCRIPSTTVGGSTFEYQLGVMLEGQEWPIFGKWRVGSIQ